MAISPGTEPMIKPFFLILSVLIVLSQLTATPLQWSEIPNPTGKPLFFSQYFFPEDNHPRDHFYTWESNGTLWHVRNRNWKKVLSANFNAIWIHYAMTRDSALVRSVVMPDYRSLITIIRHGKTIFEDTLASVPLRHLLQLNSETFIITGDWGHFYVLENDIPRRLEVPFTRHVVSVKRTANENLWISVREEGFYFYDHHTWQHTPVSENLSFDISVIFTQADSLTGYASRMGAIYSKSKTQFILLKNYFASDFYWYGQQAENRKLIWGSKGYFYDIDQDVWEKIPLAGNVLVNQALLLSDSNAVVSLSDGTLLQGERANKLYFRDLSGYYNLDGGRYEASVEGLIHDFTGNGYDDILLLNSTNNHNLLLFAQIDSMVFIDETYTAGLNSFTEISKLTAGDINGDSRPDLVLLTRPEGKYQVLTLANNGNRFEVLHRFPVDDSLLQIIEQITLYDMDDDGVLDLLLTGRYSVAQRKGAIVWYEGRRNRRWSDRTVIESTQYWNRAVKIADLDRDGKDDLYIANFWHEDVILFDFKGNCIKVTLPGYTNTYQVVLADFFPDGYPDIVRRDNRQINILKNNGNRTFTEIEPINLFGTTQTENLYSISAADINGDGLPDLLLSYYPAENQIWLNNGDETFSEVAKEVQIAHPPVRYFLVTDLDNDGDPDIYGLRPEHNCYWENQQSGLKPRMVQWNGSGSGYSIPALTARFQTMQGDTYTVWHNPSLFYITNKTVLPPGTFTLRIGNQEIKTITSFNRKILEYSAEPAWVLALQRLWYRGLYHLHRPQIWYLLTSFFLMLLVQWIFLILGTRYLHWSWRVRQGIIIGNLTLYWLLIVTVSPPQLIIRYGLPLVIILLINVLPYVVTLPFIHRQSRQNLPERRYELLRHMMIFDHGEWAMDNLNGLILLLKNYPQDGPVSHKLKVTFSERIKSFLELTKPRLDHIVQTGRQSGLQVGLFETLSKLTADSSQALRLILTEKSAVLPDTAVLLMSLKTTLTKIKQTTYSFFSSPAIEVIEKLLNGRKEKVGSAGPSYHLTTGENQDYKVLMPAPQLADLLDNLLQNAEKAVSESINKDIFIIVKKVAHLCRITVADSGPGVPPATRDHLFDMAWSGWNDSGKGLALSRTMAENFGGRLMLAENSPTKGAAFVLELSIV